MDSKRVAERVERSENYWISACLHIIGCDQVDCVVCDHIKEETEIAAERAEG